MATPEGTVKAEIHDYLVRTGAFFFRMNSGKVKVRGGWVYLCPPGTADYLVFQGAMPCWAEIKKPGKVALTPDVKRQGAFAEKVQSMGHRHAQVQSLEEFIAFLS